MKLALNIQMQNSDKLICEINGSIIGVNPETGIVKVVLDNSESTFSFPIELFENKPFVQYGQPIKYQILEKTIPYKIKKDLVRTV